LAIAAATLVNFGLIPAESHVGHWVIRGIQSKSYTFLLGINICYCYYCCFWLSFIFLEINPGWAECVVYANIVPTIATVACTVPTVPLAFVLCIYDNVVE